MSEKRPERKESGEWAVHLRPKRKKRYWKRNRKEAKAEFLRSEPVEKETK